MLERVIGRQLQAGGKDGLKPQWNVSNLINMWSCCLWKSMTKKG